MEFAPNSEKDIIVNGIPVHIYFFSYNKDKPIGIILHGHRSDTLRMLPVINLLEKKYNMIGFDLPGFGKSGEPSYDKNYIDSCSEVLEEVIFQLKIKEKDLFVLGISLGGNVLVNYLIKHPNITFKKFACIAPTFSVKLLVIKPKLKKFVFWFTRNLSKGGLLSKISQSAVNNDRFFKFVAKTFDKDSYDDDAILDYEMRQWRLMTMQLWGKSLYDLLNTDYTILDSKFDFENVHFVYPENDQYFDAPKCIIEFKKLFPKAQFNYFQSDKHIPKGDYAANPDIADSMKRLVDALG